MTLRRRRQAVMMTPVEVIAGLFVVALWLIPFVLVAFLFRTLGTIVEGLRSINLGVQRTAAAVEALAAEQQVQQPPQ